MTVSLSPFPGSQPCRLAVKVEGPQQQQQLHAVSPPSSAAREKHRPSMLHTDRSKFGSVSSLPPYEALYGASRSAQDGSPILDMVPTEVAEAQAEPPLPSLPRTLEARVESLEGDSEIELDESIQLDRLVLRSSLALAAAQAVLAGTLSVRGAILDLNSRDVEGDAGLERIEVETHIRMRRDAEQADALEPLLRDLSAALDGLEDPSFSRAATSKSSILSRRLEVGRGSVGELSATRVEAEWTTRRPSEVDQIKRPSPSQSSHPTYSLDTPGRDRACSSRGVPPSSPLADRANVGRPSPVSVDLATSSSSLWPLRRSSTSTGDHSSFEPPPSSQPPGLDSEQIADRTLSVGERSCSETTPTKASANLPAVERPMPSTPDPPKRSKEPSPSCPRAGQHTRSLSAFLPSVALPSLAGSSAADPPDHGSSPSSLAGPSAASSPAISRLRSLGASPSATSPQPAAKSWGWFATASPS